MFLEKITAGKQSKKRVLLTLFLLFQLLLVFNFIIPGMEKLAYYEEKVVAGQEKVKTMEGFKVHLGRQKSRLKTMERELKATGSEKPFFKDTGSIMEELNQFQKEYHLNTLRHHMEEYDVGEYLQVKVSQKIEADYANHISYLREIENNSKHVAISSFKLKSLGPLQTEPLLQGEFELTYFLSK